MSQPSFTSWVAGYSSFLTYRTPDNVGLVFEAKFHFTTDTVNQVALLLFMGQKGTMRQGSDYLAVSYIKGHVLLTWDLGAGPRRIFTPVPVDERWVTLVGSYRCLPYLMILSGSMSTPCTWAAGAAAPGSRWTTSATSPAWRQASVTCVMMSRVTIT